MKTINFFKSALLAAILLIGGNAWGQEVVYDANFVNQSGAGGSYSSNVSISLAGQSWLASYCYFGNKEFRLGHNKETGLVPAKFLNDQPQGASLEMLWDVNNVTSVSVVATKTYGTCETWYIFESTDQGSTWTQVATGSTVVGTWSYSTVEPKATARYAFVVSGTKSPRVVLTTVKIEAQATSSVATPEFSPSSGTYTETQNVEITCATDGATIYYTLDGSDPTILETAKEYTTPIKINTTTTLNAVAMDTESNFSSVASATYTILTIQQATIEDFLAASESEDVYYELTGRMSNITNTTYGNFDLTDATGTVYVYGLTATMQKSNDRSFASLRLAEGDVITIRGTRASYSGTAQVGGPAYFVSKTILPVLTAPVANEATTITANSFIANWEAVENATSYELSVWTEESVEFGVANSSFENGLENWVAEDAYSLSTDNAHTGTQSLYFSASKTKDLRQTINNVTPGETITVSYWYYLDPTMTGNGLRLWCTWEGSDDTSLQVQEYSNVKGAWTEATISTTVPAGATALNLEIRVYNNSNGYLDDITVTQTNTSTIQVQTPITGSPFTVTETSKAITGLTAETTYHYSVVAKAESYTDSEASNIIDVTTSKGSGTGLCHPATLEGVSFDGQVIRNAAGLELSVYTVSGVCVKTAAGDIDMSAMPHGIYLVRSANAVLKITK